MTPLQLLHCYYVALQHLLLLLLPLLVKQHLHYRLLLVVLRLLLLALLSQKDAVLLLGMQHPLVSALSDLLCSSETVSQA
jgi:hypothetical protein